MKKKTARKTEVCKTNFTIVFQQWSVSILSLDKKKILKMEKMLMRSWLVWKDTAAMVPMSEAQML